MGNDNPASLISYADLLLDAICVVDAEGLFVSVTSACERIFGYTSEEMIGKPMMDMVLPEDRERTREVAYRVMAGELVDHFENRYVRKDGQVVDIMWSARWSDADQVRVAIARDVTRLKQAEAVQSALYAISEAAHTAESLEALFCHIHAIISELLPANNFCVALYDEDSDVLSFPYYTDERITAPSPAPLGSDTLTAEVIRTGTELLLTPERRADLPERLRTVADSEARYWLGVPLKSSKGAIGALVVKSYADSTYYAEKDLELLEFVSTQVANAIERKRMYTRLQQMAQYDALTGLANRALFQDLLKVALAKAKRQNTLLALLYLDLDRFKYVNDAHGHTVGDRLLKMVARRLQRCLRKSTVVARLGGDEFLVMLDELRRPEDAWKVADKIRHGFNQRFDVAGHSLGIRPSIGVAVYPEHGDREDALLRSADEAMYRAKRNAEGQPLAVFARHSANDD